MVKFKSMFKIWFVICIVGIIIILKWFDTITPTSQDEIENVITSYRNEYYSGVIIKKFIDREEHNFKKIILKENNLERTLLFDMEVGGIYEFFTVGDTLIKNKGSLKVRVIRKDIDTLINLQFVKY